MVFYPYPRQVDKEKFRLSKPSQSFYGLPNEIKFCKSCVISNQRPSSTIEFKNNKNVSKKLLI